MAAITFSAAGKEDGMKDVRAAWKKAYRDMRAGRRIGGRLFPVILSAVGARAAWDGKPGREAVRIERALQRLRTA